MKEQTNINENIRSIHTTDITHYTLNYTTQ